MTEPTAVSPLVLLVEDDRDTREMYVVALGMSGFRTAEAGTAAEARAAAHALRPDVVVSDLTLPDADGCDLCAELAGDADTRHVPTIALTGRSSDEDLDRCAAAGCVRVLVKPCPPDTLATAIDEVLREAAARPDTPRR
jgi:CheY-like chemotaxis protein